LGYGADVFNAYTDALVEVNPALGENSLLAK
jgi:hypothetical protein